MNVTRTLRTTSAASVLGAMLWSGISDHNNENIRKAAIKENRALTQVESRELQSYSGGFYLGVVSVPAWIAFYLLDERKNKSSKETELPDYQI